MLPKISSDFLRGKTLLDHTQDKVTSPSKPKTPHVGYLPKSLLGSDYEKTALHKDGSPHLPFESQDGR